MGTSLSSKSQSTGGANPSTINIENLERGDILKRPLVGMAQIASLSHFGVYVGRSEVIHFTQESGNIGKLDRVTLEEFAACQTVSIQTSFPLERRSKRETAAKAIEIYYDGGQGDWTVYDTRSNNCEHFTNFCAIGEKISTQSRFTL